MKEPVKIIQLKVNLEDTEENMVAIHKLKDEAKKITPSSIHACILVQHITVVDFLRPQPSFIKAKDDVVKKADALIAFNKNVKKDLKKKTKKGKKK